MKDPKTDNKRFWQVPRGFLWVSICSNLISRQIQYSPSQHKLQIPFLEIRQLEKLLIKLVLTIKANGVVIDVFDQEFTSNSYLTIDYTEETTEYIKDCSESLFFKCWAGQIAETKEFDYCSKRCVPVVYRSTM